MSKCKSLISTFVFILVLLTLTSFAVAASYPAPRGFVNDFANVMDQRSRAEIQLIAEKLQKEQGIELAVVTLTSTDPLDPKEYITGLFNTWGVGGPEDSGLVILLSIAEGAIEVEPGYGLEGVLPDGLIGAVIDQEGIPHFKNKDYSKGLVNMARAYANILAGEKFEIKKEEAGGTGWLTSFVIFLFIVILLRRNRKYPPGGTGGTGSTGGSGGTRRPVIIMGPTRTPGPSRGGGFGGGRPSSGGFGGGRSGGGGAGRRF